MSPRDDMDQPAADGDVLHVPPRAHATESRDDGHAAGVAEGNADGAPEGRVMALILLVRRGALTREQARAQLLALQRAGVVPLALACSGAASIARTGEAGTALNGRTNRC